MHKQYINPIIKVIKYSTIDNPEFFKEREFIFDKSSYRSKDMLDLLIEDEKDLFEIDSIHTKREVKIVYYTTNETPLTENKEIFYTDTFKNNKEILDHLIKNFDLEFINKIEIGFILE